MRPPLSLQKTLTTPFDILQHTANAVSKYIDAPIIWVELQMVADNGQQPVQPRVHTGRSARRFPLHAFDPSPADSKTGCSIFRFVVSLLRALHKTQIPWPAVLLTDLLFGTPSTTQSDMHHSRISVGSLPPIPAEILSRNWGTPVWDLPGCAADPESSYGDMCSDIGRCKICATVLNCPLVVPLYLHTLDRR